MLLDLIVVLFQFLNRSPYHFPWRLNQMTFSPTVDEVSFLATTPTTMADSGLFDIFYSHKCEIIFQYCFDLYFPNHEWRLSIFHMPLGHHMSLWGSVCSFPCPFVDSIVGSICWVLWVLYRFWISTLYLMCCVHICVFKWCDLFWKILKCHEGECIFSFVEVECPEYV